MWNSPFLVPIKGNQNKFHNIIIAVISKSTILIITNCKSGHRSSPHSLIKALLSPIYAGNENTNKHTMPICQIMQSFKPVTNLSVLLNVWNMQATFGASFVISGKPYNLKVDKLVGREVCHMFSIHKYWLWRSCWLPLTLVGFHFGTNLYKMCLIYPQFISHTMCTCSA